ncbi:MAG: rhomboid family intramembrane serine protease [Planctomycetota bacterium]|jgi:membrane associated rhomboid family serine protease/Zn-finger nucleic acid-binding protein
MKCPFCSNSLRQVESKSAVLDICPNCRGIWFDSGEFVDFVRALAQSQEISPEQTKLFTPRDVNALHTVEEKERFCPRCSKKLHKFNYAYDSNVFLDKCPACGGIWADGGEVEEVARYLKEDPRITAIGRGLLEHIKALQYPEFTAGYDSGEVKSALSYLLYLPRVIVPLSDDVPRKRFPAVTVAIIALCVSFFITRLFLDPSSLAEMLDLVPKEFWMTDLIRSIFLSGGLVSLIWNMLFLWLFGDNVEDRFGRLGYLVFFLSCGIFASFLYRLFNSDLSATTIGLSGAVSGVMGAYFLFYPTAKIKLFAVYRIFEVPAVVCLGAWFLFQFVSPFLFKVSAPTNTLSFANIGGFLLGAFVAFLKKMAIAARE